MLHPEHEVFAMPLRGHRHHPQRHHLRQKVSLSQKKTTLPRMDQHKASPPTPTTPNHHHQSQMPMHGLARLEKQLNEADVSSHMPMPLASRNSIHLHFAHHRTYTQSPTQNTHFRFSISIVHTRQHTHTHTLKSHFDQMRNHIDQRSETMILCDITSTHTHPASYVYMYSLSLSVSVSRISARHRSKERAWRDGRRWSRVLRCCRV